MLKRCLHSLLFLSLLASGSELAHALADGAGWNRDQALANSQAALGRQPGDWPFTRADGMPVHLSDYAGKPLLISLVFTSCHHVCPATTRRLAEAVQQAQAVLGEDSFQVLTIGFDTANDTPQAMHDFARAQAVSLPGWDFLSAKPQSIASLTRELGFIFDPSPRGFDHLTQVSILDREGRVYRQVYGMDFELPALVEPLKQLVFNRPDTGFDPIARLSDRVRLFCTVYDPASGRYHFDYSLFIQIAIGGFAILAVLAFLWSSRRRAPRPAAR